VAGLWHGGPSVEQKNVRLASQMCSVLLGVSGNHIRQ
jgi:hypothetical protein